MSYHERTDCRLCRGTDLRRVLTLASTPPANEFVRADDPEQDQIPLYLARCQDCWHVQLPVVVDPARLFANYVYVSGTSPAFVEHFHRYAKDVGQSLAPGDLVVEIGSNDGTLLRQFKKQWRSRVIGVDPAQAIAELATRQGIPTWATFFTPAVAEEIVDQFGYASLVVANNVFAHADDLEAIAAGVRTMLRPGGRFVFEVQYLGEMLRDTLFDMVYHEHLSYHALGPLHRFFRDRLSMSLYDVEHVPTHGGSIRCFVSNGDIPLSARAKLLIGAEERWPPNTFTSFADRIQAAGDQLRAALDKLHGKRVVGYGAPAKLTTLCHQFGITAQDIAYVVDDSPWKQGLLTPGTRIPVGPSSWITDKPPQAVVVFAWNFAEQIVPKIRALGFDGPIIVPLPVFKELHA